MKIRADHWLRLSAVLALVGLAMMVWSLFDSRPIPVVMSMSVGQVIGTLSFLLYVAVVIADLRRAKVLDLGEDEAEGGDGGDRQPPEDGA